MTFEVPSDWSNNFETTIVVEPLGDAIYPSIYLKKIELEERPQNFTHLLYPSIVDYDLKFGDNFSYQLYSDRVSSNSLRFNTTYVYQAVYTFTGTTRLSYTYYTMAVYSNVYGMTDVRKQNFKLTITSVEKEDPRRPVQQSHEFLQL